MAGTERIECCKMLTAEEEFIRRLLSHLQSGAVAA
jgi:hypothetical protein